MPSAASVTANFKQAIAVIMVLKVVTTLLHEEADHLWLQSKQQLGVFILRLRSINREKASLSGGDKGVIEVKAERKRGSELY